ncbi:PRC-barrel domain-containing protein [Streptomyces orinoci]|uniref:PRC-barrel domain-containing protein n=1 Tax=Streptomyces orinoci TaxID=67339 RepID=A0ABV3K3C3_STRON|nr:PRC-barrel domain-containing protein [Streptomyces orinoci]
MMILLSQVKGLRVVTAEEAVELGTVDSLTLDPATGGISRLRLAHGGRVSGVAWPDVRAVGPDAVIVSSADTLSPAPAQDSGRPEVVGARVLTELGDEQGTVKDIGFDPVTGLVQTVYTTLGSVAGEQLRGLGDYALVVRAG